MNTNFRKAFNALNKLNCPLRETDSLFKIDLEQSSEELWGSYYDACRLEIADNNWLFGISPKIHNVLHKYGLHAEWDNAGQIGVYE